MPPAPRPPLLRRVPPGVWMALIWCLASLYAFDRAASFGPRFGPTLTRATPPIGVLYLAMAIGLVVFAGPLRRRRLPALAVLLAGVLVETSVLDGRDLALAQTLVVGVAVCYVAATRARSVSVGTAVVLAGALLLSHGAGSPEPAAVLTILAAWLVGNSWRQNRRHAEDLRAQAAAQAVTAERLRIARELHDMVAHSIGIIAIQAGVAGRVIDTQPAEARTALGAIEATSRETLSGLRRMLGALRRPEPGHEPSAAPLDPAPGLADLDRLVTMTSDAGVRVDVRWRGERRPLPGEIDLSAYRIVQEAVTNVVRHAGTGECRVFIEYGDDELSIEVVDDGRGCALPDAGYGIVGMRERAGLLHGRLNAGPRPEGGFRVAARLPVPAAVR